jgi:hypothetical protein
MLLGGLLVLLASLCTFVAFGIRRLTTVGRWVINSAVCVLAIILFGWITYDEVPYSWRQRRIWPPSQGEKESTVSLSDDKLRIMKAEMEPGDELWSYDSTRDMWRPSGIEVGFAVIRHGKTVKKSVWLCN